MKIYLDTLEVVVLLRLILMVCSKSMTQDLYLMLKLIGLKEADMKTVVRTDISNVCSNFAT